MTAATYRKVVFGRLGVEPEPDPPHASIAAYLAGGIVALCLCALLALFGLLIYHYGAAEALPMIGVSIAWLGGMAVMVLRGAK